MRRDRALMGKCILSIVLVLGLQACATQTNQTKNSSTYEFSMHNDTLAMRDGIELAVTYYLPTAKTQGETFPVILEMLPYRKDDFFALGDYEYGAYFAKRGYVVARVDVRGTGGSTGPIPVSEYSQAEIADAEELVGKLAQQSWSNGNVGMYGLSWSAFNSLMTAHRKPAALKAIIAAHGSTDLFYNDVHYIDGALHIDSYAHQIDTDNAMPQSPDYRLDTAYFENRFDREPWLFTWLRQQQDGDFWRQESVQNKEPLQVPAYLIAGLLDGYRDFAIDVAKTAKAPVVVEIGPWNHAWPEYGVPGPNYEWRQKALRWWDYWLKGIDNGVLDEPQWTAFMRTGHAPATNLDSLPGYWRCAQKLPFDETQAKRLYPQAKQKMADKALSDKETVDTLAYRAGTGLAAGGWWGEQIGDMVADDAYSLVYDSEPLTEAIEIMGMPAVHLRVIADAPLYQWSVRLEDVAPDGQVSLISGATINPSQRYSRLQPVPLVPGEATTLSTEIHFTTWRFNPGHKIRLAVSNAQFPMIWPTPTAGVTSLVLGADTWIDLPVVAVQQASDQQCAITPAETSDTAPFGKVLEQHGPVFESKRNAQTGDSEFTTHNTITWTQGDNLYQSSEKYLWTVNDASPANARYEAERSNVFTISGQEITLRTQAVIQSDQTDFNVTFTKMLYQNGSLLREKSWMEKIPRNLQ